MFPVTQPTLRFTPTKFIFQPKTPVTPEGRPYSVPTAFKKMQNAEVRAVQTPAMVWKRCAIA